MRIAFLGTRGIPGNYGGFETFVEELSVRLVASGHDVTVYCRSGNAAGNPDQHRGVRLVHLPAIRHKYAETLSHTLLSALHGLPASYDIVYVCNSANAPICLIPWLSRTRVVLNVDGLEWERQKWGALAKAYYRSAARLAARLPIEIVTDAEVIRTYYRRRFRRETRCIAYGTSLVQRGHLAERLAPFGLEADRYVLYVSRMEPENNALMVVEAYKRVATDVPLVMVGDAPYATEYIRRVRETAGPNTRFLGFRFGDDYRALQSNALLYVQATEVGGTHPALVEAMGHGNAVLAHDVPEHREVLGAAGRYFDRGSTASLAGELADLLTRPTEIAALRRAATERARERYSWDAIAGDYERYFEELTA